MSEFDDEFLLRPGKIRGDRTGRPAASFLGQVRRAAQRADDAGGGARRGAGASRARRGRGGARSSKSRANARRVIVKARIVRHAGDRYRAAPIGRHIAYLQRDGVSRDGEPARMFDARSEHADVEAFAQRCEDDRHHFRFIISPEDAGDMADLRAFTRDLMGRAEQDLSTKLDWVAVDHWNTDNPHVHVLVRGRTDDGQDLVIAGDYIGRGLRERAQDLVTLELGPRSEHEISVARDAEIRAERWTSLDRDLAKASDSERQVDLRGASDEAGRRLLGRMGYLEELGLAEAVGPAQWRLAPDHESRLKDLAIRGDIIKTYHRAMMRSGRPASPERLVVHPEHGRDPVIGRLVERGLDDELAGSAYVLVDGADGRQHHLRFADLSDTTDGKVGAIVELRGFVNQAGEERRALVVRSDMALEAQVHAEGATWLDRQILKRSVQDGVGGFGADIAKAATERVDVLVKRGLGERRGGGVRLSPNLLATLEARELATAAADLTRETGRPARAAVVGDSLNGVYQRRIDLASGRFAVLDDGLGFQLAPWRSGLEPHRGLSVAGEMTSTGVAWRLGRSRGPGL